MPSVAIVYHTGYGHTGAVAEAVKKGAESVGGTKVHLLKADELPDPPKGEAKDGPWADLEKADAIIFGCPTYMGSASAGLKKFMEATSGLWYQQRWKDKLAGGFTNSGTLSGDKLSTMTELIVFAGQHSMVWVSQGIMPTNESDSSQNLNRLGSWLGVMTQSDNKGPDETPPQGDRHTAEQYGKRIAELAARWAR